MTFFAQMGNTSADLIPLFTNIALGELEQTKFYMEKERFKKLDEIDLTEEKSMPPLSKVVEVAKRELLERNSDRKEAVRVAAITISPIKVLGKRIFFYNVRFEDFNDKYVGSVYVASDGRLVPHMKLSEWKRLSDKKKN